VKNHDVFWFSHDVFANGGLLELWMSPKPNKKWGKDKEILNMLDPAD
jgi:putative alpha-1,2-mannosidase